ncbi:GNAT family N-acetyltransferase [Arcicella rosea]|uniref:Putative GNAT family N-acyltransferase n=1 Tax=Arcicella rosea TaxID=502909 RepID=A0A841ENI6_9BACT|nr:GNAT family N-acetyltransferase [Arcicella rosea]MBB6004795.1 putative GNAT family N-acyltransferase [Arcicella rosea]
MQAQIQKLANLHKKDTFSCGQPLLDNYISKQANQDVKRKLSVCYVLVDDEQTVKGYYTLSANAIKKDSLPEELSKKLPKSYEDLPVILLGRLAIDKSFQGKGFGEILLLDALNECYQLSNQLGTIAVVVDAIDTKAQAFYESYGFILLPSSGKMFLPMKTIEDLIFNEH